MMKKRLPKTKPGKPGIGKMPFTSRLVDATREAGFEVRGQTLEQAKETFIEHWGRAAWAALTIAQQGTHEVRELANCAAWLSACIEQQMWHKPEAGKYVFRTAQRMTRYVAMMSNHNPPPAWLVELAPKEYEVPWLMVNGKPAPGFAVTDTAFSWGQQIMKRGKSRFDAPQTRAVAEAIYEIRDCDIYRRPIYDKKGGVVHRIKDIVAKCLNDSAKKHGLPETWLAYANDQLNNAALPLTQKTKAQWWPAIRRICRRNFGMLTEPEKRSIRATLDHDTPSSLMNEYLKRCKIAFDGLCPPDAPGEKSPDSYPIDLSPNVAPCPATKQPKGAKRNGSDEVRSDQELVEGRGGNARRSPRNHGGRHRDKGRAR